jgi:tRNA1(Val) A37 N6-methylase TrmN6
MADAIVEDALFDRRLRLRQPAKGYRAGTDAILLAACAPADPGPIVLDAGSGVGAVGLAVALRAPKTQVLLVEIDPVVAELARQNIVLNQLEARGRVIVADVLVPSRRRAAGLADAMASFVVTNPPFFDYGTVPGTQIETKGVAHVLQKGATLGSWIAACLALATAGGRFAMVHRPEALPAILAACQGRLGAIVLKPVQARQGEPAIRILISGVKGSRAPVSIAPSLILHDEDGRFTKVAEAIHRGDELIGWP